MYFYYLSFNLKTGYDITITMYDLINITEVTKGVAEKYPWMKLGEPMDIKISGRVACIWDSHSVWVIKVPRGLDTGPRLLHNITCKTEILDATITDKNTVWALEKIGNLQYALVVRSDKKHTTHKFTTKYPLVRPKLMYHRNGPLISCLGGMILSLEISDTGEVFLDNLPVCGEIIGCVRDVIYAVKDYYLHCYTMENIYGWARIGKLIMRNTAAIIGGTYVVTDRLCTYTLGGEIVAKNCHDIDIVWTSDMCMIYQFTGRPEYHIKWVDEEPREIPGREWYAVPQKLNKNYDFI